MQQQRDPLKRLALWDPSTNPSGRFIVGHASSINLYDWQPKDGDIRVVSSHPFQHQQDPSILKCMAWSPHSNYDDLVAAASTAGRLQLLRVNASTASHESPHTISTPPVVHILPRMGRACNALSFSPTNPNYLAGGFDKNRGEHGLLVWDIESAAAALPNYRSTLDKANGLSRIADRPVSRVEPRPEARVIFQHGITEAVSSVAFVPTAPVMIVGAALKYTRIIDMRTSQTNTGSQQVVNKYNSGICVDPFDEMKFACYGEDGAIRIWDRRFFAQGPLLCFTEADGESGRYSAVSAIGYCPTRRGLLGSLGTDDSPVRLWSVIGGHYLGEQSSGLVTGRPRRSSSASRISPRVSRSHDEANYLYPTLIRPQSCAKPRYLANFCFANTPSSLKSPHVLTVSKDGVYQVVNVPDPPNHLWSARGDLAVALYEAPQVRHSAKEGDLATPVEPWDLNISGHPEPQPSVSHSKGTSRSTGADESRIGRSPSQKRTDDVNFPPLPVPSSGSSLTATRPPKSARTYSPSSIRRFGFGQRAGSRGSKHSPSASPRSKPKNLPPGETPARAKRDKRRRSSTVKAPPPWQDDGVSSSPREANLTEEKRAMDYMRDDISMVMRRRVVRGYSMESAVRNANIALDDPTRGDMLSDVWNTLARFMDTLRSGGTSRVDGYDFAYRGLFGIWEGFSATPQDELHSSSAIGTPSHTDTALPTLQVNVGHHPSSRQSSFGRSQRLSMSSHTRDSSATSSLSPSNRQTIQVTDFDMAVDIINEKRIKAENAAIGVIRLGYPSLEVKTSKPGRRKLALALCEWDLNKDDFIGVLNKWEGEGQTERAACWATLMQEYDVATEFLMRSKVDLHRIISGTIAALLVQKLADGTNPSQPPNPWRDNCQRMINRLSDPYIRIMLSYLIDEPWLDILLDEAIRLNDRLGIIFRFLEDDKVTIALRRTFENAKRDGDLDGLLFTGLTEQGMDVLQAYVDRTGDVQTAAILASYVCPARFKDERVEHWVEAYQNLLDTWGLFHFRCQFDIERGMMLQHLIQTGATKPFEWVKRQLYIRCNYCNKVIDSQKPLVEPGAGALVSDRVRTNCCPSCAKTLPRCVICLMAIGVPSDAVREAELNHETPMKDTIEDAVVFCQTCRHGGHASHVIGWFFGSSGRPHSTCAVADCDCRCADI